MKNIIVTGIYPVVNVIYRLINRRRSLHDRGYLGKLLLRLRSIKALSEFGERSDDIYIATFPRSGTTWMQMLMYQLTTDGSMDFNHIYDVSPFLAYWVWNDKPIQHVPSPRIIKTHDPYEAVSERKGRAIYIVRNGMDVVVSLYHHRVAFINPEYTFEDAFNHVINEWFPHVSAWLKNEKRYKILYIRYEDMLSSIEPIIRQIADFIGMDLQENQLPRISERSSFPFMKMHQKKFGEQPDHSMKPYDTFIRRGKANQGKEVICAAQKDLFQKKLDEYFHENEFMKFYMS